MVTALSRHYCQPCYCKDEICGILILILKISFRDYRVLGGDEYFQESLILPGV